MMMKLFVTYVYRGFY